MSEELNNVIGAIIGLDTEEEGNFTAAGLPNASVLSEIVGFQVTKALRDEAWEKFNAPEETLDGEDTEEDTEEDVEAEEDAAESEEDSGPNLNDKKAALDNLSLEETQELNDLLVKYALPTETALGALKRLLDVAERSAPNLDVPEGRVAIVAPEDLGPADFDEIQPYREQGVVISRVWKDLKSGTKYFQQPYAGKQGLPVYPFDNK